jgi:hypothetical protein
MPPGYGKDLADSAPAHTRAGASALRALRPQPARYVLLVVCHGDERGVAGRRALHQTNLTVLCRGCHQLEHGRGSTGARRRPPVRWPVRPTRRSA